MMTVAWMVVEGAVAVAAGVAAHSLALSAFGVDSGIEIVSAAVVLRRLWAWAPGGAEESSTAERRASRVVGLALYGVVAYIVVSSVVTVLAGIRPEPSVVGLVLLVASIAVMAGLWRWRLRLADQIGSPALRGDAACSAVCLYLSVTALAGLALNSLLGWWWADPVAALLLIWWIRGEANEALEASRATGPAGACCS
jgi:divalent metal cation (Fe/Co/Zn/Cd) transporter